MKKQTLNEWRAECLLSIAVNVAAFLDTTPEADIDAVCGCARQLVRTLRQATAPSKATSVAPPQATT
jgi:hypothetical protein